MFSDFIKHYNNIRDILRDCFLYGCFSRENLESKRKISSRKVSYEVRRIQQYVEGEYIKTDKDGRNKLLSLTYDFMRHTNNFLVNTYTTKSFTRADIVLYFYILMVLQKNKSELTFTEIENVLIDEGLICYDNISSKTIERKLKEMAENIGVLKCDTVKRNKHYSISADILEEFSDEELMELHMAINLYKNIIFPVTAGYFCEDTLKVYIKYERCKNPSDIDCFGYRNLHFHPVIEEQVLWELFNAIHEKREITLTYRSLQNNSSKVITNVLRPYKIKYDVKYGRFYLISFDDINKCVVSRLDRIEKVALHSGTFEREKLNDIYDAQMGLSWSSMPLGGKEECETVKLEIFIKEPDESFIIDRIKNEVPNGIIERIDYGKYSFVMKLNDTSEIIPWLRSYSVYIKVIEGDKLAQKMEDDWRDILNVYGVI